MTKRSEIILAGGAAAISHYTDAVRFGDLLFISGMVALDAKGHVVGEGDVAAQTDFILGNIGRLLESQGGGFADVLRVTLYLLDVADRTRINPIRQKYFGAAKPASTLIGVKQLALPGLLVEIEAVAGFSAP